MQACRARVLLCLQYTKSSRSCIRLINRGVRLNNGVRPDSVLIFASSRVGKKCIIGKDMKRIIIMTAAIMAALTAQAQVQEQTSTLADTLALDGSPVVAQKVLVKMDTDKVTYKVEDDVDAKTSTVLDMLRKVSVVSLTSSQVRSRRRALLPRDLTVNMVT